MRVSYPYWLEVMDSTWPAATFMEGDEWKIRVGKGGGKRVCAATCNRMMMGQLANTRIAFAEAKMKAFGQMPVFMIFPEQNELDAKLAERGYDVWDASTIYCCAIESLTRIPLPPVTVLGIWEPLEIMQEIWTKGGIGKERWNVMDRVQGPKSGFLVRMHDRPVGVAFAAVHQESAMVHAIEILPQHRCKGAGAWLLRGVARWSADFGVRQLCAICTDENAEAIALYASLGFSPLGRYHYRMKGCE